MFEPKQKIDLSIPTSYSRCTLRQLRGIASIMIDMVADSSPLRPFVMEDFKTAVFFFLTNLEVVSLANPDDPIGEQYYQVRFSAGFFRRLWNRIAGRNKPFLLYLWQVEWWIFPHKNPTTRKTTPGMLDWLDADSKDLFLSLPMDFVTRRQPGFKGLFCRKRFKGPNPIMDGFTWKRFRYAQDYMQYYIDVQNRAVSIQKMGREASRKDLAEAVKQTDNAKALFLATIFEAKIRYNDESTGQARIDYHYQSDQSDDNQKYFLNFPDADWQIVLLWWSGVMAWLGQTYPRVFKKQSTKPQKPVNPLELYSRTTATMEKYIGINADAVEREPYTTILQQMEDIARQNEETERMQQRMKK